MNHALFPRKNMLENRVENSIFLRGKWIIALLGGMVFLLLIIASAAPVSAQSPAQPAPTPFVTPTPLPAVQAAYSTAQQAQSAAQASLQQAAQLDSLAAEMRRNAEAQQAQAVQAYSDARAATAAQNAAAVGEAIGRGEYALSQLRDSVNGQAGIIATLTAKTGLQASEIYSLTVELQAARTDKQTILASYTALKSQTDRATAQQETDNTLSYIVKAFIFIVALVLLIALIVFVIQRRAGQVVIDYPANADDRDNAPLDSAAPDAVDGKVDNSLSSEGRKIDKRE